jgi:hypothetical protein
LNMSSTDAKRRHEVFYRILSCTLFIRWYQPIYV